MNIHTEHNIIRAKRYIGGTGWVDWYLLYEIYGHKCGLCNKPLEESKVVLDHIIPRSGWKSGVSISLIDSELNLHPAHQGCNARRITHDMRTQMRLL